MSAHEIMLVSFVIQYILDEFDQQIMTMLLVDMRKQHFSLFFVTVYASVQEVGKIPTVSRLSSAKMVENVHFMGRSRKASNCFGCNYRIFNARFCRLDTIKILSPK